MQRNSTVISVAFDGDDMLNTAKMNISHRISTSMKGLEIESGGCEDKLSWISVKSVLSCNARAWRDA